MRTLGWVTALGLVGLLGGCGGSPPPPPPAAVQPAKTPTPAPPAPVAAPTEPDGKPLPPIAYAAKGRRDPFRPPVLEANKTGPAIAAMRLVGIVQGRDGPLALIEAPDGLGYILRLGDAIGDGRVAEIGVDSVTFSVAGARGQAPNRLVLRLKAD